MEEEIRKQAIYRHIVGGESPKSIYTSLKRSKPWFFKWLKRYQAGDADWFKDQGRAPRRRPTQTSQKQQDLIIATRQRLEVEPYAQIGVTAIKWALQKLKAPFPSDRTITRILKREGLVKKNCVRPPKGWLTPTLRRPWRSTTSTRSTWWGPGISRAMAGSTRST